MKQLGYRTVAVSTNTQYFSKRQGFGRGFLRFDGRFYGLRESLDRTVIGKALDHFLLGVRLGYSESLLRHADDINESLFHWLDADGNRPVFACLNFMDVHAPYYAPPPFAGRFAPRRMPAASTNLDHYDDSIAYLDDRIGALKKRLQARSGGRDTILILISDHGETFGEHGQKGHGNCLYREIVHVPLIVWAPTRVPSGLRIMRPVSTRALPATVLDLVHSGETAPFKDRPLTALWQHPEESDSWPYPLSESGEKAYFPDIAPIHFGSMKSLVTPQYHLILNQGMPPELYDWKADPKCLQNLAGQKEAKPVLDELSRELDLQAPGWAAPNFPTAKR
jgi:arylsulfatase A-like enzyme